MKICICTTPIRPEPATFPPFGSMAIIQSLRKIFNIHGGLKFNPLLLNENTKIFFKFGVILYVALRESSNLSHFIKLIFQHIFLIFLSQKIIMPVEKKSLRKIVKINSSSEVDETIDNMIPLRQGTKLVCC